MREKELRFALICYGGISLAVYMHGITKEVWKLSAASRAFYDDVPQQGSGRVYGELLNAIAAKSGVRLRVLADIVAGASAGGINGIFLARAIATGQSLDPLTELWLKDADVDSLLDPDARPLSAATKVWAVPLALMRVSGSPWLNLPVWFYTYVIRGTPMLVQLFLLYYGVAQFEAVRASLLWPWLSDATFCACLAFAINTSGYTAEIIAGCLKTTPPGEIEAARAAGMSRLQMYRRILLPSALRRALPQYSNEVVMMLHATSMASLVTLADITVACYANYAAQSLPVDLSPWPALEAHVARCEALDVFRAHYAPFFTPQPKGTKEANA